MIMIIASHSNGDIQSQLYTTGMNAKFILSRGSVNRYVKINVLQMMVGAKPNARLLYPNLNK
jgi:hypothetical protein